MRRRFVVKSLAAAIGGLLRMSLLQAAWNESPLMTSKVRRVLVMFKCHFDAGFIDTQANVVRKYFEQYFPRAIDVASEMRQSGEDRYIWTTGSWLLYEYLEQARPAERRAMESAIQRGDIAWHALPFSWQTEMLDQSMIAGALSISQSLDRRFRCTTSGAKMTDVPGHTRALIAPLATNGVTFLDIGVNGGSTPAELPPLFLWKNAKGQTLTVMYHSAYGGVTQVPGSDLAIAIEVRDDNTGPHDPKEIAAIYQQLRQKYPNATVVAANLSDIANAVAPHRDSLPVVTQEVGDTWIHGVGSDPLKVARYRELARLRRTWISQGKLHAGDAVDLALLRHVLLEAEHTWGTDTKTWLDFTNYKPADLSKMLDTKNYRVVEFSWQEKRQNLLDGIGTLPIALRIQADDALAGVRAKEPKPAPGARQPLDECLDTRYFSLAFDRETGAITRLYNKTTKKSWASKEKPIGLFTYQTLSQSDYDRFFAEYIISKEDWVPKDFGKPNIADCGAKSREWMPALSGLYVERTDQGVNILAELSIATDAAFESGLASYPRKLCMQLWLPDAEPEIHMDFSWFGKSATRLPEAMWLTFNPVVTDEAQWNLVISDEPVAPLDVIRAGNRHMHAVSTGFSCTDDNNSFTVDTLDAPLVSLGERNPLAFSRAQPDLSKGVHCNLFNNTWGTNYVMWFNEDMRFRFVIRA